MAGAVLNPNQLAPANCIENRYYKTSMFSDVTIIYGHNGERTFYAHKVIICSKSKYFQRMFEGRDGLRWREADEGRVNLRLDDPEAVEAVLEWMYCRMITGQDEQGNSNEEHIHNVSKWIRTIILADYLGCDELVDFLFELIRDALDTVNIANVQYFCDAILTAYQVLADAEMLKLLKNFLLNHALAIWRGHIQHPEQATQLRQVLARQLWASPETRQFLADLAQRALRSGARLEDGEIPDDQTDFSDEED